MVRRIKILSEESPTVQLDTNTLQVEAGDLLQADGSVTDGNRDKKAYNLSKIREGQAGRDRHGTQRAGETHTAH